MTNPVSLKEHLKRSIIKQSVIGALAMIVVLLVVAHFLGRYKAATDLAKTASASAKAFRSRILEGDIKAVQSQLSDLLKLEVEERATILSAAKTPIYQDATQDPPTVDCNLIGIPCVGLFHSQAEILIPIFYDDEGENVFGYLYLSRSIHIDWIFFGLVSVVFMLGYFAVFFGVTRITKSTMLLLAKNLENWSLRLSQNPKDLTSLSETPFAELLPLKDAIEGLNRKIKEYESKAAEEAKFLILRGIAHDLIGPLAQTQLYLATLKKKAESEATYSLLIGRAMDSVKDVIEVASQVKMLKESPDPKDHIDLATETKREVEILQDLDSVRGKEIRLALECQSESTLDVSLSRAELKRILQNLVQNSADASSAKASIQVGVRREGNFAVLSVKDKGHGIPKNLQSKVFQPDFTLKPGTGTGLGLTIVSYIAKSRRGSVRLDSSDSGTLVEVAVPIFSKGVSYAL